MERTGAVAVARLLLLGSLACAGRRSVVEDRGPLLAGGISIAAIGNASFAWLPGGEIAYLSMAPGLDAVRIADGAPRQLDSARPWSAAGLARSLDGSALYFVAEDLSGDVPHYAVREALAHQTLPVDDLYPAHLTVSPDARRLLYRTATGSFVFDAAGAKFSVPCGGWGVLPVFSPSGDSLLCDGNEFPFVVDVVGSSIRNMPATAYGSWRAVRWGASGPQVVALVPEAQGESVYLVNVATGRDRMLHQVVVQRDDAVLDFAWTAISNDGARVAFWETACLGSESLLSCDRTASWLMVVNVDSAQAKLVASGADAPGPIAFSDDGTRVAYALGGDLHARTLR